MKKVLILLLVVTLTLSLTSCGGHTTVFSGSQNSLKQEHTDNSWKISFKSMNGHVTRSFNDIDKSDLVLNYSITCSEGSITVEVSQGDKVQELSLDEQSINLSDWEQGNISIKVIAAKAKDATLSFSWGTKVI